MSMTERWTDSDATQRAALMAAIFADVMADKYQLRIRLMGLDAHDLRVFAHLAKLALDAATSELQSRDAALQHRKAEAQLNAATTERPAHDLEHPPAPNGDPQEALAAYRKQIEARTILYDDRPRLHVDTFVGICRDDGFPDRPFLAVTVGVTVPFETPEGAARWYAQEVGLEPAPLIAAVVAANQPEDQLWQ